MDLESIPSRPRLYEQVAGRITAAIDSGVLRPGDRLPSIRRLSEQHRVSVSTVLQAYAQLESAGVLEARPQSGHYVRARRGLVLLCGSFSKTLAHGYRVGWVAPGRYQDRVQMLKFSQTVATTTLPQRAIAKFIEGAGYDRHVRTLRRMLASSMHRMVNGVSEYFPAGTRLTQPKGGMVLWVELPRKVSALELHRRALEERISIAPGPIFSARQRLENFVRLNAAQEWDARVEAALARLGQLSSELAAK